MQWECVWSENWTYERNSGLHFLTGGYTLKADSLNDLTLVVDMPKAKNNQLTRPNLAVNTSLVSLSLQKTVQQLFALEEHIYTCDKTRKRPWDRKTKVSEAQSILKDTWKMTADCDRLHVRVKIWTDI